MLMSEKVKTMPGGRMVVAEAAKYLGLAASTLDKLRCQGKGPRFMRINGKRIFYRQTDLDEYLEESMVETVDSRRGAA
jgi:predicted DNA-binding transcriptional regulator AlpA